MSLGHDELDELLASLDQSVSGMVGEGRAHESPVAPALVSGETGLSKPSRPTAGHTSASDASCAQSASSGNPSLSPSSSVSSPRPQLPAIGSRPNSRSAPPPTLSMSSTEATADLDALTASLEIEGVIPPQSSSPERDTGSVRVSSSEDKFTALPPLMSTSPRAQSLSKVAFEANSGTAQELGQHENRPAVLERQGTDIHFNKAVGFRSVDSPRASSSQSPRGTLTPRGVVPIGSTISPSRRRLTIGTHDISPHALERLGVNTDILKKEKGMKKLGISDVDIQRSEEIRRYSGVPQHLAPATKVEFMFGFTKEQLLRAKAMDRLGTSEEEVMDEYSRRVSKLGEVHESPAVHIK